MKNNFIFCLLGISMIMSGFQLKAQQTKRNMIANSCFEEDLKNWRKQTINGAEAEFSTEINTPISGGKSAKIKLINTGISGKIGDARLCYMLPVEKGAKYKVIFKIKADLDTRVGVEFAKNYDDYEAISLPRPLPDGFLAEGRIFRGTVAVTNEVKEYVFTTNEIEENDWNYVFSFNFGSSDQLNTTYIIDDIKISRADAGDWDGNLFPIGDFEGITPRNITSGPVEDYSVRINSPLTTFEEKAKGEYTKSENLITYDVPDGYPQEGIPLFNVAIDGKYTGVYTDINAWSNLVSFGYFDFTPDYEVEVEITAANSFGSYEILPATNDITSTREGNTIRFRTKATDKAITVVFDNDYKGNTLHLFANSIDTNAPTGSSSDLVYFGRGYHDLNVTHGGRLNITGNQKVYIAGGAVVSGTIGIENGNGAMLSGRGILMKTVQDGLVLSVSNAQKATIDGVIFCSHRNGGWTVGFHLASNVTVTNAKVVSTRYASTDGFDIVNSNNINLSNVFIRSCDDAIAIKGLIDDAPENCPPNENMTFENIQLWNDCNNAICLGAETRAKHYKNIHFKNIDVLFSYDDRDHHEQLDERSVMSIVCLDGTFFSDISFEDVRVNRCERLICLTFKDSFWFGTLLGDQSTEGGINGVIFKNITSQSNSGSSIANEILLNGWYKINTPTKIVENITFDNVMIEGAYVQSQDDSHIKTNNSRYRTLVKDLHFNYNYSVNNKSTEIANINPFEKDENGKLGNWGVDNMNILGTGKSLSIEKIRQDDNNYFWNFIFNAPYWVNENAETEAAFIAKSGETTGKIDVRAINVSGDLNEEEALFFCQPQLLTDQQTFILNKDNSVVVPSLPNSGNYNDEFSGKQYLCFSFHNTDLTPVGLKSWIDNIIIKEAGIELEDFEVLGLPAGSLNLGTPTQLSIGEFVTPTHAPTEVIYEVENNSGEADVTASGLLTGTKIGEVIVYVSNPQRTVTKNYLVKIEDLSSIHTEKTKEAGYIYPTVLFAGETINIALSEKDDYSVKIFDIQGQQVFSSKNVKQIATSNISQGMYVIRITLEDGNIISAKIIVR